MQAAGVLNLRVHVIPRGRFDPYLGVGAQYSLLRGLYDTPAGATRLGFHGLAFPFQAGFVYFVHENIGSIEPPGGHAWSRGESAQGLTYIVGYRQAARRGLGLGADRYRVLLAAAITSRGLDHVSACCPVPP